MCALCVHNNEKNAMIHAVQRIYSEEEEEGARYISYLIIMLRFGCNYEPHRGWDPAMEEEWRRLLRESMCDLNRRAFIADCKKGDNTRDQPPHDYFSFNPDDWISVFWHAYAVYRCIDDVRKKAMKDKRDLPPIEALPQAIRRCSRRLLMENQDIHC